MYRIIANPHGCCDKRKRGNKSCVECYYSQVNSRNQWIGTRDCFDAPCIKAWPYKDGGYEVEEAV